MRLSRGGEATIRRVVRPDEAGLRLVDLLARWTASARERAVPRARLRAAVVAGAVRIGGRVERRPGRAPCEGESVLAVLLPSALRAPLAAVDRPFRLGPESVLYQDEVLVAVAKPPGLPTHATADPTRPNLVGHVREWLAGLGREPYVGVHQRLDRDTSGVILFAIERAANAALARAFADGQVEKTYLALAARPRRSTPPRFRVSVPLMAGRDGQVVTAATRAALPAETEVVVRERLSSAVLLEVRPWTGRKHQIRVHLAHVGMPLLGDRVYGPGSPAWLAATRTMLHSWRLALPHPTSGRRLVLVAPPPADFQAALDGARAKA
jgi:23S rRNA pseudouridine1911/1915/1917 synthase